MAFLAIALFLADSTFGAARPSTPAAEALPPPLATLQAQLAGYRFCADEIVGGRADWWGFWWTLPERGCGDCEDFAAFSYATLRRAGVPESDLRLMAAEVGQERLGDGKPARVLHVWLEAEIAGRSWTIWNREIRAGAWRRQKPMDRDAVAALVEDRFGPNWPYGLEIE